MTGNIEYIVAGGPLHGRIYDSLPSDDSVADAPLSAQAIAARQRPHGSSLCIAAKRRLGNADTWRYIVLHPQATGEQFLTILAA